MSFADVCRTCASCLGKLVGASHNILVRAASAPRNALRRSAEKFRPMPTKEKIRSIVTEELIRLMGEETELTRTKLEERLQVMAEAIESLQEEIAELSTRGPFSEADMFKAIDSLKTASSLTDDERAILANIFRQNIAIQKPELVGIE